MPSYNHHQITKYPIKERKESFYQCPACSWVGGSPQESTSIFANLLKIVKSQYYRTHLQQNQFAGNCEPFERRVATTATIQEKIFKINRKHVKTIDIYFHTDIFSQPQQLLHQTKIYKKQLGKSIVQFRICFIRRKLPLIYNQRLDYISMGLQDLPSGMDKKIWDIEVNSAQIIHYRQSVFQSLNQGAEFLILYFLFLTIQCKQMKSPLFHQEYNPALNLSAVYDGRKSKASSTYLQVNNGDVERQKEIQHNRSFVFDKEIPKKQYGGLRSTIGSPRGLHDDNNKPKIDSFLRNTSHFTINYSKFDEITPSKMDSQAYKQSLSQKNTPVSSKKQYLDSKEPNRNFESTQSSYNKIMQKYDKKQKLINQLKKLSDFKISDKIKDPFDYEKGSVPEKRNQLLTDRIKINVNSPKLEHTETSRRKIDLNRSTVDDRKKNQGGNYNYLREKILNKAAANEEKQAYLKPSSKNPEEQFKKSPYYTPKVPKSTGDSRNQSRNTPKINTSKDIGSLSIYLNVSDVRASTKQDFSVSDTSLSREIYSPTIPIRSKEQTLRAKTMKDIKVMAELKKDKSSTNHFAQKKLTIHDFELGKSLGEGKFGTVYQAVHKETRFLVALKKITKMSIKSNYMIDQFLLEVKIQSFCEHENILKLYGCFDDKQHIYLVLQYMEEGTLFKFLKQKKIFTESQASTSLRQVAQAVKYLHEKGIAHRDIKPENIVISNGVGKLCDFGWAAICNERRKTYCGTFDYAAPEILEGEQYDMSVDLWCMGVLAYELMVGKAPFYHISRKQTMKKILNVQSSAIEFPATMSKQAISFIQNLVRKRPEERMTADNVLRHPFLMQRE